MLSRREYNPRSRQFQRQARATGRRRRSTGAVIYGSSGYFIGLSGRRRTPAAGLSTRPGRTRIGRASNTARTRITLWSLLSSRRNRRRWPLAPSTVTALSARCCPSVGATRSFDRRDESVSSGIYDIHPNVLPPSPRTFPP